MTRLHDLYYGPRSQHLARSQASDSAVQEVVIHAPATRALRTHLRCTGRWWGGPIFGSLQQGTVGIEYITPGTVPGSRTALDTPLAMDADYVLGWADALSATHQSQLDWQGMWVMAPNAEMQDALDQLRWVYQARQQGLLTEERALLFVGWQEGRLSGVAYIQRDEPEAIPVAFENGGITPLLPRTPRASE
ncbi:hypothetical protein [Deinococcus fonticola]|uniref:hypothetical protein n=1 Tax=Deinococcus fonticola TaxID=2528713 RepID=UPI0010756392|nr:hypothetical protein [Deinococcus fonticola]